MSRLLRLVSNASRSFAPDTVRAMQAQIGFLPNASEVRALIEDWKSAEDGFGSEAEALGVSAVFVLEEGMDVEQAEAVRVPVQRLLVDGEAELPDALANELVNNGVCEEVDGDGD